MFAAFTAHTALHPALGQTGTGELGSPRPGQTVCDTQQRMRRTRFDAGAAFRAAALIKPNLWKAAIPPHQNALRAGWQTGIAAGAAVNEIDLQQGPRRPGSPLGNRGGNPATQEKSALQIHESEVLQKGKNPWGETNFDLGLIGINQAPETQARQVDFTHFSILGRWQSCDESGRDRHKPTRHTRKIPTTCLTRENSLQPAFTGHYTLSKK